MIKFFTSSRIGGNYGYYLAFSTSNWIFGHINVKGYFLPALILGGIGLRNILGGIGLRNILGGIGLRNILGGIGLRNILGGIGLRNILGGIGLRNISS